MRKLYLLIFAFIISFSINAYAEGKTVVDEPDYLTTSEEADIEMRLNELKNYFNIDVAVVMVESIGSQSAMSYADDYYDYKGYGMGVNDDGILLLICKETRDYHITTHAQGEKIFNESGLDYIEEEIVSELIYDNYYEACIAFSDTVYEIAHTFYEQGVPYGEAEDNSAVSTLLFYVVVISMIIAIIITKKAYSNMNTARKGTDANLYVKQDSLNVTRSNDIFLYSNLVKTKIESSSSSGGGSRTHRSSSGRSHGGRGGKF